MRFILRVFGADRAVNLSGIPSLHRVDPIVSAISLRLISLWRLERRMQEDAKSPQRFYISRLSIGSRAFGQVRESANTVEPPKGNIVIKSESFRLTVAV